MRFDILTLFPEMFPGYLGQSLLKRAIDANLVDIHLHNIRDWATDKHKSVDDRPFGGGPGMVLKVEPVVEAVEEVQKQSDHPGHLVMMTPQGKQFSQSLAESLASRPRLTLMCGRYEGFDERVRTILQPEEISVGDYVLNGGEVAAMVVIDAVVRLLPGVLGDEQSAVQDSFSGPNRHQLEFSQYTRPREYRGHQVPEVLLSGHHEEIAAWRQQVSLERTHQRREDLIKNKEVES
ncbi:MAG: tRNA (guanosine(37)-N1)-methyltransferase TrmD [Planctomycetales bacterium]